MIYEVILPHYLAIGVDYNFFMKSTPRKLKPFEDAHKLKRQMEDERDWIQGQYIMSAFGTVLSNAFSKHSKAKYIEKPILSELTNTDSDPEANERLAVLEMQKYISVLHQQGDLPETIVNL